LDWSQEFCLHLGFDLEYHFTKIHHGLHRHSFLVGIIVLPHFASPTIHSEFINDNNFAPKTRFHHAAATFAMAHKRVKNVSYDEGDISDGYDEEYADEETLGLPPDDELSAEDEEKLQQGTKQVRTKLGPASKGVVTDVQIREKLWNSWYDVDSVVGELSSMKPESLAATYMNRCGEKGSGCECVKAKQTCSRSKSKRYVFCLSSVWRCMLWAL
jgi:HBS1 N-terminus